MNAIDTTENNPWAAFANSDETPSGEQPIIPLPSLGILQMDGEDADAFLQAQLSADLRTLQDDNWIAASYCSPKGRVLALMTLWREKSAILTALPQEIIAAISQRLILYRLRSRVQITPEPSLLLAGLTGKDWQQQCQRLGIAPPANGTSHHDVATGLRILALSDNRALLIGPEPAFQSFARYIRLSSDQSPWWQACIQDQQAEVFKTTQDVFVPQMLNLDKTAAVSFRKGCYPGQEVVARMHYLGKAKQRMLHAHGHNNNPIAAGDAIRNSDGQRLGNVVLWDVGSDQGLISIRLPGASELLGVDTDQGAVDIQIDATRLAQWQSE